MLFNIPIDIVIFALFLIITLGLGITYGQQVKTLKDYALGGKNFSTPVLAATIVATWTSGWVLALILEQVYTKGLSFIIAIMGDAFALLFIGYFLASRAGKFLNNVSVAETMGNIYGRRVRFLTAISGIAKAAGIVAVQFQVSAKILTILFGLQGEQAAFITAITVILYSTFGGIRAVTFTDVFQFITFGVFIPILTLIVWNKSGATSQTLSALTSDPLFSPSAIINSPAKWSSCISLLLFFTVSGMGPALFQRISMSRNTQQAKHAFLGAFGVYMLIILFMVWLAILVKTNNPGMNSDELLAHVLNNYTYTGLKGCITAGIMAMVMSTADSYINTAAVLFTHDIIGQVNTSQKQHPILIARIFSLFLGLTSLWIALAMKDLLEISQFAGSLYIPLITAPLLLTIFGFRTTRRVVLSSMAVGLITVTIYYILYREMEVSLGLLANLITMLCGHYLLKEPGGWEPVDPDSPEGIARAIQKEKWRRRIGMLQNFNIYNYFKKSLPKDETTYVILGLYIILSAYISLFTIGKIEVEPHYMLYKSTSYVVFFITTAIITFPLWPAPLKQSRIIAFLWPISILMTLFVASTLLLCLSNYHPVQVILLIVNLIVATLVLQWPLAIAFAAAGGIWLGLTLFQQYTGEVFPWHQIQSLDIWIAYTALLLVGLLLILFNQQSAYHTLSEENDALAYRAQKREEDILAVTAQQQDTLEALKKSDVTNLLNVVQALQKLPVQGEVSKQLDAIQAKLVPMAFQLKQIGSNIQDYLRLTVDTFHTQEWRAAIEEKIRMQYPKMSIHYDYATKQEHLVGDETLLTDLLIKSISLVHQTANNDTPVSILVKVEDTLLAYPLPDVERDYIKKVPALRISITAGTPITPIAPHYMPQLTDEPGKMPESIHTPSQLVNNQIIKAHYGHTEVKEASIYHIIPANLALVRPSDMDLQASANNLCRYEDDSEGIAEIDRILFNSLDPNEEYDLSRIKMALELVKWNYSDTTQEEQEEAYAFATTTTIFAAPGPIDDDTNEDIILSAILYNTAEKKQILLKHIQSILGTGVVEIVKALTHQQRTQGDIYKVRLSAQENLRMLERTENESALLVRIAARATELHNIIEDIAEKTAELHDITEENDQKATEEEKAIARETLRFFAPAATRLGILGMTKFINEQALSILGYDVPDQD